MVHASWNDSPDCQTPALKPSPGFCVVDLSLRVEPKWMLGLRVSIMGMSLLSLQIVLRNERPILKPWDQLLLVLFFLEKRFYSTGFQLAVRNSQFAKRFDSLLMRLGNFPEICESLKSELFIELAT